MAPTQVDQVVKIYRSVSQSPSLSNARIIEVKKDGVILQSSWSQRNLERRTNQCFMRCHVLNSNLQPVSENLPTDTTTELKATLTEDGQYRAVLRQTTVENSTKQFIEIWDKYHLMKNYDLAALDVHGDVYTDSEFGAFCWSPDKTKLLYIAEKKLAKSEPFYKQKSLDKKEKEAKDQEETTKGNEYIYKPDWGEQLVAKHRPVVVVLDTVVDTITTLSNVPDDLSPGQVLWTPDGQYVVGVAWEHEPRRLGLVACTNRISWIFILKDGEFKKLSGDNCAVRSPRFSPNGKYLVWLEREVTGPHNNAHRLMRMEWDAMLEKIDVLIDVTTTNVTINNGKLFYGIYDRGFCERCWSDDSKYLFLSTHQRANVRSYIVNVDRKVVTEIENDASSLSILDVKHDIIAFLKTSLTEPSKLVVGYLDSLAPNVGNIVQIDITTSGRVPGLENVKYEHNEHVVDNNDEVKQFNSIYFGPKSGDVKSTPLIVVPHGGPHAAFSNLFSLGYTVFTLLGFGVLQVNYRGSTGMGSKNVEYLQGRVGDADVKDCVAATEEALRKYPWLDPSRIGLYGGSHGGFLVAHLSGQFPSLYRAVVTRNPVIDIASLFTSSDIPDCRNALAREERFVYHHDVCAAAINCPYQYLLSQEKSAEMFLKMYNCSPIVHVTKVQAPTLICIGTNDLRVPSSQGKQWYYRLKANNVKTKMLAYEDNHPLAAGPVEIDNIINGALWLIEHTAANKE